MVQQLFKYDVDIDLAVLKYDSSMKLKPIKISKKKLKYGRLIGITTFRTKDEKGNPVYGIAYSVPVEVALNYINE